MFLQAKSILAQNNMKTKSLLTGKEIASILVEDACNIIKNHGNEYIQEAIWILKAAKYANKYHWF